MLTKVFKIDKEGRYIIVFQATPGIDIESLMLVGMERALREWWDSGRKFFPLSVYGIDVRLERVEAYP